MRKRLVTCALAIALCIPHVAAQHVEEIPGGMKADVNGNEITLQFFSPGTLRVTKIPAGAPSPEKSLSVTATPAGVATSMRKSGGSVDIKSDAMTARLNLKDGSLTFYNAKGKTMLKENGAPSFTPVDDAGTPALKVKQRFAFDKDEAVYGLGNLENGTLSQRGITRTLMPGNVEDGIPVILSVKGYGIFWDNYSPTTFFDTPGESGFESEVGPGVDYYIMAGDNADGVIAEMRGLTGSVPMFPLWTYGFWQSRERYKSQEW
jgi:alpha-D-xyloside xylohydrolase